MGQRLDAGEVKSKALPPESSGGAVEIMFGVDDF